jgi:hypothetical protein
MMFVVDNLQYYLMADVLESQFSLLLERLKQSTNFEELRHSHDIFLSSVISNTFVNNKPVNQCLTELLQCCISYCQLVEYGLSEWMVQALQASCTVINVITSVSQSPLLPGAQTRLYSM